MKWVAARRGAAVQVLAALAAIPPPPPLLQCYLVTHAVLTLTNYGELRVHPSLLPHEFFFLREHLPLHMRLPLPAAAGASGSAASSHAGDVHLVGETIECLRCFGCSDADPLIQAGIAWLCHCQGADGAWDRRRGSRRGSSGGSSGGCGTPAQAYVTYHATMVALHALMAHHHRGWGPGPAGAGALLREWQRCELERRQGGSQPLEPGPP
jgi:hypothetical protein